MAQPERSQQRQIVAFLRQLGATVYVIGTTRRRSDHQGSMQSVGLPDLLAFVPFGSYSWLDGSFDWNANRRLLTIEVKAPKGRLSPAQLVFRAHCADANVEHLIGGLDVVLDWALTHGLVEGDHHNYRRPRQRIPPGKLRDLAGM